jgi:hypothetical protein
VLIRHRAMLDTLEGLVAQAGHKMAPDSKGENRSSMCKMRGL